MTPIGALACGGSESRRQPSALGTASTNMNKSSISVMAPMMSRSCLASIDDASYSERLHLRRWSTNPSQDRFLEGGSWQRKEIEPRPNNTVDRYYPKEHRACLRTHRHRERWPNSQPSTNAGLRNYHQPRSTPSTDGCSRPKVIRASSLSNS